MGNRLDVSFLGDLNPEQKDSAQAILAHDTGVLSAATAFGKTVVAAYIIAARSVNTLVLVHRKQLLDQWISRLKTFLDIPDESIGQIGGGKRKPTGIIDVATIQSLSRKGVVDDIVADYTTNFLGGVMKAFKKELFIIVILILSISNYSKAGTSEFCSYTWPDDYKMRKYCQNQQAEAEQELLSIAESEGLFKDGMIYPPSNLSDRQKIIFHCMSKWKDYRFKTYDYIMVVDCIKQQFENLD
jgi:hypothetical protein